MNWLNRLLSVIFPWKKHPTKEADAQRPVEPLPPGCRYEDRMPFGDHNIQSRLPAGMRVFFVSQCRSNLYFSPDRWERECYSSTSCQNRYAIEVEDAAGKVVAAVGWTQWPDESSARTFGTFVSEKLRRRGLAQALWKAMIRECGKAEVRGVAATDEGHTLLASMREAFPGVVSFCCTSSTQDLRTKRGAA